MKVVIVKYNAGNIRSVLFALERIGIHAIVSDDERVIKKADKVIFPGVGEASTAMAYLKEKGLDRTIVSLKQPVLGICLGMQLLCNYSEENDTKCLGIFNQTIKKFSGNAKIPEIGWNNIYDLKSPLFKGIAENSYMYFVHGYYAEQGANTVSRTDYITSYSSALQKDNFYAVQFHPEKSGDQGQLILQNFLNI
jgi:glutamine amidotransferase